MSMPRDASMARLYDATRRQPAFFVSEERRLSAHRVSSSSKSAIFACCCFQASEKSRLRVGARDRCRTSARYALASDGCGDAQCTLRLLQLIFSAHTRRLETVGGDSEVVGVWAT